MKMINSVATGLKFMGAAPPGLRFIRRLHGSWFLPLMLLMLPATVRAQFTFTTNNGSIMITGYTGPGGAVTIPSTTNGWPVTAITNFAFASSTNIISISIPDSVTNMGEGVFSGCPALTSVALGNGIASIPVSAFSDCMALPAFAVGNGVTSIGAGAFSGCENLTNFTMGSNVTSIGNGAFFSCTSLPAITIGGGVTDIGITAFDFCESLASVVIPDSTTNIPYDAFANCLALTNVTIGRGVTSVGQNAFWGCGRLQTLVLPASVSSIGYQVFYECTNLTSVVVDPSNSVYVSVNGVLFTSNLAELIQYPAAAPARVYNIPNGVLTVGDYAFSHSIVAGVTIPDTVISIGSNSFENCYWMTNITMGSGLKTIGVHAFWNCGGLSNLVIGSAVTSIANSAFFDCSGLTNVTFGASVTSLADSAFESCNTLKAIHFLGDAPNLGGRVFLDDPATVYYLPGMADWSSSFGSRPTALWLLPYPLILNGHGFGVQSNAFGFTISWATNIAIIVDACTNLPDADWAPLSTNTFTAGLSYFTDPAWTNYSCRFYRVRSP
jgi:hypothetical protein